MLIINALQKIQAKAQAVFEHHNFRQITLKKSAVTIASILLLFPAVLVGGGANS